MEFDRENIYNQMRQLIKVSCSGGYKSSSEKYEKFQIAYLKFYFDAIDVSIDYPTKIIRVKNCKPLSTNSLSFYNLKESVIAEIHYSDLEETMDGCLEEGKLQMKFYEMLILNYGDMCQGSGSFYTS